MFRSWAEAAAAAEEAAFQMAQPGGMVTADGKVSPWFAIHASATKTLNALALRLRIGPQSRARTQSKKELAPISYYDKMRAQKDWDRLRDRRRSRRGCMDALHRD